MSYEIDEASEVYKRRWRVARKPHRCDCCDALIPPGAQYERHHMVNDGTASDEAACFACAFSLLWLMQVHGSHPSPSWAVDHLRECIHDHRLDRALKAEERETRSILAGMLSRYRVSRRSPTT